MVQDLASECPHHLHIHLHEGICEAFYLCKGICNALHKHKAFRLHEGICKAFHLHKGIQAFPEEGGANLMGLTGFPSLKAESVFFNMHLHEASRFQFFVPHCLSVQKVQTIWL